MWFLKELFNPCLFGKTLLKNITLHNQQLKRNFLQRYKGSVLGILWSFILPLLMLAMYTFVFSVVFRAKFGNIPGDNRFAFALIMFTGMSVYMIFQESVATSCSLIIGNPSYVKKVVFPLEILPFAQVITSFLHGIPWFLLILLGVAILGEPFHFNWTILLFPVTFIPLFLYSCGISFFVSSLSVYVRDLQYVVGVILQVFFFMSPVFYPMEQVPKEFRFILQFNPLSGMIEETRKLLIYGQLPDWKICLILLLISGIVFQMGYYWFYKTKKGFADVL